jgi:hypothetical protein
MLYEKDKHPVRVCIHLSIRVGTPVFNKTTQEIKLRCYPVIHVCNTMRFRIGPPIFIDVCITPDLYA